MGRKLLFFLTPRITGTLRPMAILGGKAVVLKKEKEANIPISAVCKVSVLHLLRVKTMGFPPHTHTQRQLNYRQNNNIRNHATPYVRGNVWKPCWWLAVLQTMVSVGLLCWLTSSCQTRRDESKGMTYRTVSSTSLTPQICTCVLKLGTRALPWVCLGLRSWQHFPLPFKIINLASSCLPS